MKRRTVIALAIAWCACKKSAEPVVARLEQITAQVERMPRAAAPWQGAHVGDTFVIGSGVRTGAASRAKLVVGKSGKLDVEESSVVFFTRTPGRERSDLRVEAGIVELETGDEPIGIGEVVLDPKTRARIEAGQQGTSLVVTVGRAVLEDGIVAAGERITLGPAGRPLPAREVRDGGVALPDPGAIAVRVRGKPARVKTASGETELAVGEHQVEAGATLLVPAGGTLELARGGARAVTSGASELRIGAGATLVEVVSGSATLHGDATVALANVPGGTVTAQPGAEAALSVGAKETAIDAQRGEALVQTARDTQTLAPGQSAVLTADGELTVVPPPPARTVVSITAGESPTLHDPRAPTPIRVAFDGACPGGGTVEVAKDRAFKKIVARAGGAGSANVLVPPGSFRYRVRCAGGRGASGSLRVAKDSGRTPLPKAAARTTVEMDGREYTILYQNLLPELTLGWRNAPRGKPKYTFVIKPTKGAERRLANTSPTLKLLAGELREGSYKVWIEPDGGPRSEESRIVIEFDNAAKSASIDAIDTSSGALRIKGTVIENSTVSAGGVPVQLDRHRRFDTELAPRTSEDGVSVRIAHPKAGIHYYVMRTGPT